jgi:hypothetical protein
VTDAAAIDIGEYCRRVEDYLTRVNGGHLVRIVGPGFLLVRGWAEAGIPLTIVFRGIELKAERHTAGSSKRPLRIEFCDGDVRAVYDGWRRAVGLHTRVESSTADATGGEPGPDAAAEAKRPSLSKHLERAIERLVSAGARLDLPAAFRDEIARVVEQAAAVRDAARKARGEAREALHATLAPLDTSLVTAARAHTDAAAIDEMRQQAVGDLAPFRARLPGDAWERSVALTVDRLVRERYGLPTLDPYAS